jgi:hypothetical protein
METKKKHTPHTYHAMVGTKRGNKDPNSLKDKDLLPPLAQKRLAKDAERTCNEHSLYHLLLPYFITGSSLSIPNMCGTRFPPVGLHFFLLKKQNLFVLYVHVVKNIAEYS